MDRFAIFSYVQQTRLSQYDDRATAGVGGIARDIKKEVKQVFRDNIADLGPFTTRSDILSKLTYVAHNLSPKGVCLFYFHGHGDSIPGRGIKDEAKDQALVCYDDYLCDDDIDTVLRAFKPTQRLLTIVDSCSSETVVEWSLYPHATYPEIIHLASARDDETARAFPQGGDFSRRMYRLINGSNFYNYTYQSFARKLEFSSIRPHCYVKKSPNISNQFLNTKLFK